MVSNGCKYTYKQGKADDTTRGSHCRDIVFRFAPGQPDPCAYFSPK
jgi:hypothetical protein